jgi:hypothetical protein
MNSTRYAGALLLLFLVIGGCVVGDQLTTLTINPDGSAEIVVFRSNLRSSEVGDAGRRELAEYKASFESRTDQESSQIRTAGGQIINASWIRQQPPYSNTLHASFPNATVLEQYMSEGKRDDGYSLTTQFQSNGSRRKLTIKVTMPIDMIPSLDASTDNKQLRQTLADGISETRIVVTQGSITSAHGFSIAKDKQSALLNIGEVAGSLLQGQGKSEFHIEWEVKQ